MRCRVGYWKTGLSVQVDLEVYEWVLLQGRTLSVQPLPGRRLALVGTNRGGSRLSVFGGHASDWGKPQGLHAQADHVQMNRELVGPSFELPLFCIHDVGIDYDYAMDAMVTEPLAPDHELPWPFEKHHGERLSAEELRHQCYLRCRSHIRSGGHGYFDDVGVPVEVVRMMGGGFVLARDKARREADAVLTRAA